MAKYHEARPEYNIFGDPIGVYSPYVELSFPEKKAELAQRRLDATGYRYDMYLDESFKKAIAHVYVLNKSQASKFMAVWREMKKLIKEVP